jgi:ABC-2 type transport system ATP-binding protein
MIGSVCGLVKKTTGTIRVFGHDLDQDPVRPRYEVGLVPQEINFDPFFTVRESLQIQLGYYGRPRDEARVNEVLTALNLQDKADAITRALSGGMKRRLLIAKTLVHRPKLVFLDEPTAGVDVELRRDLWTYVRKLASEGTTIVLTTHYLEEAEELADRVGVINEGRLLLVEDKTSVMRRFGERRLVVTFEQPLAELPEPGRRFSATLSEDRRTLAYVEREGTPPSSELLRALYAQGLPISDVETRRSRLEDVLIEILRGRPQKAA